MTIWVRLGISVAIAAMFSIVMTEFLQSTSYYEAYKWYVCSAFLALGPVCYLIGRNLNAARWAATAGAKISFGPDQAADTPTDREPFLLFNLAYWGVMLVVFGVIIIFIVPRPGGMDQHTTAAGTVAKVIARALQPSESPATNGLIEFPEVHIQGLIYRPRKSSVILDGKTVLCRRGSGRRHRDGHYGPQCHLGTSRPIQSAEFGA